MELKNRIRTFCDHLGLSIREFERECALGRGNISNMGGAIGTDKVSKIIVRYPEINLYWLITGEGEMIRRTERQPASPRSDELFVRYRELLSLQENIIREQRKILEAIHRQAVQPACKNPAKETSCNKAKV